MKLLRGDYGDRSILLGDGGYACTNYMLTPLTLPTTDAEHAYQNTQILMRNAIERLFGVLKRRFPALQNGLKIKVETTLQVIVACAVLHNICIMANDPVEDFTPIIVDPVNNIFNENNNASAGYLRRQIIEEYF